MAKKFDINSVRHLMKTEPNEALFWSGTTDFSKPEGMSDAEYAAYMESFGGQKTAETYARRTGRKTLEMKMGENKDALIEAGFPYDPEKETFIYNDETKGDWESISAAFAEGASGEIEVHFGMDENTLYGDVDSGDAVEYDSIWSRQEYKRLFDNKDVSKLTAVDPFSEEKSEVFARSIEIDDIIPPNPPLGESLDNIPPNNTSSGATPPTPPPGGEVAGNGGFQSTYTDRIRQTPSLESNRWAGERGESICAPQSDAARQILEERGMSGVTYQNGVPDFSPFSESTVKLGYMTDARHSSGLVDGRDSKNTVYAHFEDGELVSSSHRADKGSMADLHMKYDKPGNFEQANALTAEQWTADGKDGKEWTADDVAQYRKDNGLTWHECNDMETMQMVPEAINADFGHLGGVAEVKETQHIIDGVLSQEDDGDWLEGEDFDRMSKEDLESFNRENGHYDDEGIWIPDEEAESAETLADKAEEIPLEPMIDKLEELPLEPMIDKPEELPREPMIDKPENDSSEIMYDKAAEEPIDEPAEEPVDEPIDNPVEEPVEEPIDNPAEEPVEEPIDEPVEEPVEEPIDEPAEEPVEESIDEPAEEPVDDFSDVDESSENSDITDDYTDLSDENDDIPEEATDSFDDLSDEEAVDEYDTSEDYSDLSDDVNDDFVDDSDYSDYSDDVVDEPMDSSDYADISDDVDSGSYDDSAFDSGDVSVDSGDSGSFDGGGDSID